MGPRSSCFPGCFPFGKFLLACGEVYLLYADEFGDLRDPQIDHFVVGGVAVHEDAVRPLAGRINSRINSFVGARLGKQLEIHGGPMRAGGALWGQVPWSRPQGLARSLMRLIRDWEHAASRSAVQPFVVVVDRDFTASATELAYGELLYLLDIYLRAGRRTGTPHNGILVADRSRYQRTIEAWVQIARARARLPRQDPRRLYALAEAPFFIDSRSTRLMQLADLLAYRALHPRQRPTLAPQAAQKVVARLLGRKLKATTERALPSASHHGVT